MDRGVGYSPWGHKESDMTERLSTHMCTHAHTHTHTHTHTHPCYSLVSLTGPCLLELLSPFDRWGHKIWRSQITHWSEPGHFWWAVEEGTDFNPGSRGHGGHRDTKGLHLGSAEPGLVWSDPPWAVMICSAVIIFVVPLSLAAYWTWSTGVGAINALRTELICLNVAVQSLSWVGLFATPGTAARQASLSSIVS